MTVLIRRYRRDLTNQRQGAVIFGSSAYASLVTLKQPQLVLKAMC